MALYFPILLSYHPHHFASLLSLSLSLSLSLNRPFSLCYIVPPPPQSLSLKMKTSSSSFVFLLVVIILSSSVLASTEMKVGLEDYNFPVDPSPTTKASIKPGPIEHGSPLNPYIPKPPSSSPPPQAQGGG
ncbi:PREDICTED: uncharacterized protein LOC109126021 [Camelina sativa]|uniref:Uncharacterized protein LOC109126021 n=1 Tax=Camelina sativa TaxID=90675 RepID=A0ABM1QCW1_CAMSA|nr:PREDICTED: uncharacterized protein LOC109126021 [Camelina sativa]